MSNEQLELELKQLIINTLDLEDRHRQEAIRPRSRKSPTATSCNSIQVHQPVVDINKRSRRPCKKFEARRVTPVHDQPGSRGDGPGREEGAYGCAARDQGLVSSVQGELGTWRSSEGPRGDISKRAVRDLVG